MARANYGTMPTEPDEVIFGQSRKDPAKTEFNQLCETISSNLCTIQSSSSNLERACKSLGTRRDNQGLRDSIHVIQLSAKQVMTQTKQELIILNSIPLKIRDRKEQILSDLQLERLRNDFESLLQRYSRLQMEVASKMKNMPSLVNNWENTSALSPHTTEERSILENMAEERHQKLHELKQAEFDQQILLEREQRINQIESDMIDVNEIMKDLCAMVHEQGDSVNSIENNIDRAYCQVEDGTRQLEKAALLQNKRRKWVCFLVILGFVLSGIVALVVYLELRPS